MVDVQPLRGVRFDPEVAGPVGPLLAPPYDVAAALPNDAQFSIRRIEAVDLGEGRHNHERAAMLYRRWLDLGILRRDDQPAIYVHRHQFTANGVGMERTGLLVRIRLTDWDQRVVLPHERTTPGPRRERLQRLRAVGANLSPLYMLYQDPNGTIRELILASGSVEQPAVDRDGTGGGHALAKITDTRVHAGLSQVFSSRGLFVADGHHRYEAALEFRDECRGRHGYAPDAPWEFVLVLLAAVEDPGVVVRPTHRIVTMTAPRGTDRLLQLLRRWFHVTSGEAGDRRSGDPIFRLVGYGSAVEWSIHALPGNPHHALLPRGRGAAWTSLGVSTVQAMLESIGGPELRRVNGAVLPAVNETAAVDQVRRGEATAVFLLPAPKVDTLLAVAAEGELLPAKSTWFEPKAPAGLVINDLRR